MQATGTIAGCATEALLEALASRGQNPSDVLAKVGLRLPDLASGANVLPLATFTSILEVAACDRGDETFGLELGRVFSHRGLGPIAGLFMTSRTVGEALDKFTRYFPSLQGNTRSCLSVSDGVARLSYSIADPTVRFRTQDANFTMAIEYRMLSRLLGANRRIAHVDFEHTPCEDIELYRAHFHCPVRFARSENAIVFPSHYLSIPITDGDVSLNVQIETELQAQTRTEERKIDLLSGLETWLTAALARSINVDIEYAASDFGMSLRSFQRRLAEVGVNFAEVRNRIRVQIGKCILAETSIPITSIALQLGYSETSAFSRGFKLQAGETPQEFRSRAKQSRLGH